MGSQSDAAESRPIKPATGSFYFARNSVALLLLGIALSVATFWALRTAAIKEADQQFATLASEKRNQLQNEADAYLQVLTGSRALFDASEFVSQREFDRYTAPFLQRHPNIHALEWLPRVLPQDRQTFEANASRNYAVEYRIHRQTSAGSGSIAVQQDEYWPVLYSQSRAGLNQVGLDLSTQPDHAHAMQAAAQHNQAGAVLVRSVGGTAKPVNLVFVYLPVYAQASPQLIGYVRTTLALDQMVLDSIQESTHQGIRISLADAAGAQILADRIDEVTATDAAAAQAALQFQWSGTLQIADLKLRASVQSMPAFAGYPRLLPQYALLVGGLIAAVLGAGAVFQLTRRRVHLQILTRELVDEVAVRRNSEHRLAQSEARYRVLVENNPDAILLHQDGHITFANSAAIKLFKVKTADELLGKSVFDLTHPDHHELIRTRLRKALEIREVLQPSEQMLLCADGTTASVEVLAVPFETESGVVIQVTARDITQRKAAEEEHRKLESALRQSQKIEALGILAGGIAHDFNNILSAIIGHTRLLMEDVPQSHHASKSVREILNAARRARDLVKRISIFSRQQDSARAPVEINLLVQEIQELLRATLPAGIEVVAQLPDDSPWVLGDATQIHQVLLNLCTNAWQAIQASSGRVEISVSITDAAQASIRSASSLTEASQYVCIVVRDNGSGMSAEVVDHIFEPFFTTKPTGQGSGLGLAVVHGVIKSHHGAITVSTVPNEGSAFTLYLPACAAPATSVEAELLTHAAARQHVLYLDDEEPLLFLVRRILERAGYQCTSVKSAREALSLVRKDPDEFDLIITDLNMPGMTGLDVARELLAIRADLPIVITTGYVRTDDVVAARTLGVLEVVLKPDTIEEMATLVATYLQPVATSKVS